MKKTFRVEFNETGFYSGAGIWDTIDEFVEMEADSAAEAIECAAEYMIESMLNNELEDHDYDEVKKSVYGWAWRAAENIVDEDGYLTRSEWIYDKE